MDRRFAPSMISRWQGASRLLRNGCGWMPGCALLLLALASAAPALAAGTTDVAAATQTVPTDGPWNAAMARLARHLAPSVGAWVERDILPGVSWLQFFSGAAIVLVVLVIERSLHALMRHQIRRQEADVEKRESLLRRMQQALLAPLALVIWAWGAYAALSVLLIRYVWNDPFIDALLVGGLRIGNLIAMFWLIFRVVDGIDAQLQHWAAKSDSKWDAVLASVAARGLRWIAPLVGAILVLPTLDFPAGSEVFIDHASSVALIVAVGFILAQLLSAVEEAVTREFDVDVKDNLQARRIRTQVLMLKKVALVIIGVFTLALALMVFPSVRHLGASLLASAGIAGIVVGFAAQRSLGALVAGLQLAITQPIRIDDVVIVENEWGRIEEIALTYVVVRIWDLRRLVVPTSYFLEKPFQNWTRVSADLLGSVMLYVDYTVPLKPLREELDRVLGQSPLWDGKVKGLQVTDAKEKTLELRALMSAADASSAWDLRCAVREALIDFLQRNYPQCLPHARAELEISGQGEWNPDQPVPERR